ncbi:MAG: hypothetical protein ABWY00_17550 [Dongiaceae bacterium]
MKGTNHPRSRLGLLQRAALISAGFMILATPALALDMDVARHLESTPPVLALSDDESALYGDSARQTADSDPASLNASGPDASKLADTTQSIYCRDKGGVIWYAANVLSGMARKPSDTYQVEPIRCP